jgi:hypothetical protein
MSLDCSNPFSPGDALSLGLNLPTLNGAPGCTLMAWTSLDQLPNPLVDDFGAFFEISIGPPPGVSTVSRVAFEIGNRDPAGTQVEYGVIVRAPDSDGQEVNSGPGTAAGGLAHVAITVNVATKIVLFYKNGQVITAALASNLVDPTFENTNSKVASIAAADDSSREYIDGRLEDLRVYNRVLTADEIQTIYQCQGIDGIVLGLQHRFELQSGPAGTSFLAISAQDSAQLQRDATVSSGNPLYAESIAPTFRRRLP